MADPQDQALQILTPAQVDNDTKALAWDAFHGSANEDEFASKIKDMKIPDSVKADLWDAKRQQNMHTADFMSPKPVNQGQGAPLSFAKTIEAAHLAGTGRGAVKSLARTLSSGSQYSSSLDPIFQQAGVKGEDIQAGKDALAEEFRNRMQPQGMDEKIGAGLEQTGEMALTGGPLRKAAVSATAKLPFLGKYMAPGARVAAESLNAAGNAAVHGQDPNAAALAGAGGGALSEMMPSLVPWLRNSAEKQYSKVLNPTTVRNKNITNQVVPQLIDRNVVGTEGSILNKAGANVEKVGQQITDATANVPASVQPDAQNILNSLDKYKQSFYSNGVAVNPQAVKHIEGLQDMITDLATQPGQPLSYQSLNKARQILDKGVAQSGGYAGKTLSEGSLIDAQREAANAIRAELSRQSPDISKLNAEFHFWKGVQDVMQATAERRTGQAGGLIRNMLPFLGMGGGLAHAGFTPLGGIEGAAGVALMASLDHGIKSGFIRTMSAVSKARLADFIASGNMRAALDLLTRAGAAGASQIPQSRNTLENMLPGVRSQQ